MHNDGNYRIGDFNGDGADDNARYNPSGHWQVLNGRTGQSLAPPTNWGGTITGLPSISQTFIGDFNNDNADDFAFLDHQGRWFFMNGRNGQRLRNPLPWGSQITGWPAEGSYFIGDFDGDGYDDITRVDFDTHRWYTISGRTGESADAPMPWGSYLFKHGSVAAGDFDGDGADDLVMYSSNGSWYIVNGKNGLPLV